MIECRNVGYATLSAAVGEALPTGYSTIDELVGSIDDLSNIVDQRILWKSFNDSLRNVSSLRQATINTYTYDPVFGLTSMTAPGGKTIYYEYNGFGKLKTIRNHNNKILESHQYQYQSDTQ